MLHYDNHYLHHPSDLPHKDGDRSAPFFYSIIQMSTTKIDLSVSVVLVAADRVGDANEIDKWQNESMY